VKTSAFCRLHPGTWASMLNPTGRSERTSQVLLPKLSHRTLTAVRRNGAAAQTVDVVANARALPACPQPQRQQQQTYLQHDIKRSQRSGVQFSGPRGPAKGAHCKETQEHMEAIALIVSQRDFSRFEIAADMRRGG
jgi:hypothetical protein